jgi:site-specific DNA-methyltransferase (adenine-specific)
VTIVEAVHALLREPTHLQEIYAQLPELKEESIRARIYEHLGTHFRRLAKGVYVAVHGEAACVVIGGDAWEELKKIPSGSIDALITDPPYPWIDKHVGKGTTRPRMRWGFKRKNIDINLGLEMWRVLKDGAHALFFCPSVNAGTKRGIDEFIGTLGKCGLRFNKLMIWDKVHMGMGYSGRARHETIVFASKGMPRKPADLSMPDVISEPMVHASKRIHNVEKPVGLLEKLINFSTVTGEVILDCFAGSCPTGVAALKLNRNSIMIEAAL